MPRTVHRLTRSQRAELRKRLRTHHRDWINNRTTQPEAADILTNVLGFTVTRSHVGTQSRLLHLRWPTNPRPSRGPRTRQQKAVEIMAAYPPLSEGNATPARPGKRLSAQAIDDLRHMANHLLGYAAEIEYIINNGRPSTSE